MTADRRLRIGGWAALLVAILAPIEVLVAGVTSEPAGALNLTALVVVEIVRFVVLLVAVVGLDPLFRSLAPDLARGVRNVGALAVVALVAMDAVTLAGVDAGIVGGVLGLAGSALAGMWFIGGGAILMSQGGGLARIGWSAELGGLGTILAGLALAVQLTGPAGEGVSWLGWFRILSLFVIVYLVRVWRYVVGGKLPGPGIL